ncbi:MAG: DNA mismatch repair endonuclease MutL [Candidatus Altimarinota bacterium]
MIKLLPQDLINKIAAGEVVERPASVVKEITENAVDAGATRFEIVLEEGGIKLIQIIDNGTGMSEQDAKLCLVRHATSKIDSLEDLFTIQTMGFRGEALASIAAVSQFSLVTRKKDSSIGFKVTLDQLHLPQVQETAANEGTNVSIHNLFYNVPARQKFLKSANTEFTHILRYLQQFALIHFDKELKLVHNKKTIFHYQPSDEKTRVEQVLGKEFSSKLISLQTTANGISLRGFVAKPELVHATHKNQYLFVNGRPVYDHLISRSVLEAYDTMVPRGYFPAFVLHLDLDPKLVDVNVHPRKSEVKFLQVSDIMSLLKSAVRDALKREDLTQTHHFSEKNFLSFSQKISPAQKSSYQPSTSYSRPSASQVKQALEFNRSFSGSIREIKQSPLEELGWKILGQIHLSFILVETPEGLRVFDQHAVSEITNYQRLMKERENGEVCSQQLLIPVQVELTHEEKSIAEENGELFQKLGWEIDEISSTSFQISSIPEILKIEKIEESLHDILSQLKEEKGVDMTTRELAILKYEACRGSVMFGDPLSMEEMRGLLNQWLQVENNAACEHGRPAAANLSIEQMRAFFKR